MITYTATYDPADNKIRLSASARLDAETYARVRAAGFVWAPRQEIFVAPMWTPERADLATELAGEIGDEDTSLVERAEERAERFEEYSDKRASDAEHAHAAVERIANGIPMGQPILVGHHSERRARKDAERIENGMRKAVKMWESSKYWTDRAKGALRLAKYKENPAVRYRRIKGLEADQRKHTKERDQATAWLAAWRKDGLTMERAKSIANYHGASMGTWSKLDDGTMTAEQARDASIPMLDGQVSRADRWLAHVANRLAYERAMLGETGGIVAERFAIEVGGQVLIGNSWNVVTRVIRKDDRIVSVRATGRFYGGVRGIEEVRDYKAPEPGDVEKVKAATKLSPLVNYPGEGFLTMTAADFKKHYGEITRLRATETHGPCRIRATMREYKTLYVYLSDAKTVERPTLAKAEPPAELPERALPEPIIRAPRVAPEPTKFDALKASLKAGVTVVSSPNLFPTPPELAARMVALADIRGDHDVLEPSAGTGNLLRALLPTGCNIQAIEVNGRLVDGLAPLDVAVRCDDFMVWGNATSARFDRIVMNPPFGEGQDIAHIRLAVTLLKPGGRLVALCANGPRQKAKLGDLGTWEDLPEGSFAAAGTGVRVALLVIHKAAEVAPAGELGQLTLGVAS